MCMRLIIVSLAFLPLLFSCSGQEELTTSSGMPEENIPAGITRVAFKSGPQPQCVYIFRKEGNSFRYDSTITGGWSAEGTMTARLLVGDYKFLFTGPLGNQTNVLPASLDHTVTFEQLCFATLTDSKHPGNILPAGELFLPEPTVADSVYTIAGGNEIECTLKRRVAQLTFILKRGYKEGDDYIPQPYSEGHHVLENIRELRVELTGIARQCNYLNTSGEGMLIRNYSAAEYESIDTQGFATFTGPFVFPSATGTSAGLNITLVPVSGEPYPPLQLSGKLEANRKLEVSLWLTSSYFDIGVTIQNLPISGRTNGDEGIWE